MPYMDQYRERVLAFGRTQQEVVENKSSADFERLCAKSPDRCTFTYEEKEYLGVLSSGARSAAQSERKIIFYLWGPKTILLPEGAVIVTRDRKQNKEKKWIVMNQEVKPFYGYFRYKLLELDYILKYIGSDGLEHSIPCYVNGTGTFDIKEYFKFSNKNIIQQPNRALNIVWSTTNNIDNGCRFIIGNEVWKYLDADKISIPGVSYVTLYQTGIDESQDSVEEQLAGKSKLDTVSIISNYGTGDEDEEIYINDEFTNLTFYLLQDGKIKKSDFSYEFSSDFAVLNENGQFELLGNDGKIVVTDKNSNYSKTFNFVIDQITNYFYIIGNSNIDVFSTNYYEINSDYKDINFEFDSSKINVSLEKDGRLKVVARSILGPTSITFKSNGSSIGELALNIKSSWG